MICVVLYCEVCLLDDWQWDVWFDCYVEDVIYWMFVWDDDDQLIDDLQSQILLMYYVNCCGLEDCVFCIKIECSGVFMLELRISYMVVNVEVVVECGDEVDVCYNFYMFSYWYKIIDYFFGMMFVILCCVGDGFLIVFKKIVLKNDYIWQVFDVYYV